MLMNFVRRANKLNALLCQLTMCGNDVANAKIEDGLVGVEGFALVVAQTRAIPLA